MFTESWLVDLKPKVTILPTANVEEVSNYQIDSRSPALGKSDVFVNRSLRN
jgi:hypothetical protein